MPEHSLCHPSTKPAAEVPVTKLYRDTLLPESALLQRATNCLPAVQSIAPSILGSQSDRSGQAVMTTSANTITK